MLKSGRIYPAVLKSGRITRGQACIVWEVGRAQALGLYRVGRREDAFTGVSGHVEIQADIRLC